MRLVGRYQVQSRIGQGAMANVYRAFDPGIGRVLAIKVLKREFGRNPESAARFLREAKAAGALSHPNIVTIYDVGEVDGFPYIAMELLEGQSLDQVVQTQKLSMDVVLGIAAQLADALRYAHEQGVVHRDIKPSNIMLGKDARTIKILDFGIARVAEGDLLRQQAEQLKTQVGQILGTPRYMSPEQALGHELDGRSDLFSVGVVLYELITGRAAFTGSSAATLALQITQQDPAPIHGLSPGCPRGLQFIVTKLLAKRPDKRFASGAHLLDALRREADAHAAVTAEGRRRHIPLYLRASLIASTIMAAVLALSINSVVDRQAEAMERVAITSGASIASFVASNAALYAVENATMPPSQQDWLPAQAFINTASSPDIAQMTIVDAHNVVRASSDASLVDAPYQAPAGTQPARGEAGLSVVKADNGDESFRFTQPIMYADQQVGLVDVTVRNTELRAASSASRIWLLALGAITLGVVMVLSFVAARLVGGPMRRLRVALRDAALGNLDFRISHQRRDEFGELFDSFNTFAASVQERLEASGAHAPALDATRVAGMHAANDVSLQPIRDSGAA